MINCSIKALLCDSSPFLFLRWLPNYTCAFVETLSSKKMCVTISVFHFKWEFNLPILSFYRFCPLHLCSVCWNTIFFPPGFNVYPFPCSQSPGPECYICAISRSSPCQGHLAWAAGDGSQSARPDGPLCTHYVLLLPLWRWDITSGIQKPSIHAVTGRSGILNQV